MALETRIYQKDNNLTFGNLLKSSLKDIYSSRFLARQLAERDIKAQYRQSFLGLFWMFIAPLTTAFVWIILNKSGTVKLSDTGMPYPIYAFTGTLLWSIVVESINLPMVSTNASRGILSKINFPKEALVISGIYKLLFNSSLKLLVLVLFLFVYDVGFHWTLLFFPLALLGVVICGISVGLLITPFGMLYTDVSKIISFSMQFIMYATPVVYAIPKTGIIKILMEYNPLTPLILVPRDLLIGTMPEFTGFYFGVVLVSIPLLFVGLVFYRLSIPIIVERLSS